MSFDSAISACDECLRRTWVLSQFAAYYEHLRRRSADLAAIFELEDAQLLELGGQKRRNAEIRRGYARFDAGAVLAACRRQRVVAVCRHASRYPARLAALRCAPSVLYCRGDPGRLDALLYAPAAAIVGARRASEYGVEVAAGLARGLSSAGVTVVSGMASGVDAAAHGGAMQAGAATIAVLGGPPEVAYPADKRVLYRQLVARAAVVSEWPPGFNPRPWCFVARNRVIAGLCAVTIVVEAGERSGSLTTAAFAERFGRAVAAVPGRVTAASSAGSNALLFDGAHVVRDARDALELACGRAVGDDGALSGIAIGHAAANPEPPLPEPLRRLLRAIEQGEGQQASLFALEDGGPQVLAQLSELELLGLVRRTPAGRYVRASHYAG